VLGVVVAAACVVSLALIAAWLRRGRGDFGWLAQELTSLRRRRTSR